MDRGGSNALVVYVNNPKPKPESVHPESQKTKFKDKQPTHLSQIRQLLKLPLIKSLLCSARLSSPEGPFRRLLPTECSCPRSAPGHSLLVLPDSNDACSDNPRPQSIFYWSPRAGVRTAGAGCCDGATQLGSAELRRSLGLVCPS